MAKSRVPERKRVSRSRRIQALRQYQDFMTAIAHHYGHEYRDGRLCEPRWAQPGHDVYHGWRP